MVTFREITQPHGPDSPLVVEMARVFRDARIAHLAFSLALHAEDEDRRFLAEQVLPMNTVFTADVDGALAGFIAFTDEEVRHLYVAPQFQRRGLGSKLLGLAQSMSRSLQLWTFASNGPAISFYRRHGFRPVEETDGADNEARMPDIRFRWTAE